MKENLEEIETLEDAREANGSVMKRVLTPYVLLGGALAFVPEQFAATLPYIKEIADGMSHLLPAINSIPQTSPYPATMRLYLVVMWLCVPWFTVRMAYSYELNSGVYEQSYPRLWLVFFLFIPFIYLIVYYIGLESISLDELSHMVTNRGKSMYLIFTQFRVGTALMGTLLFWVSTVVISWEIITAHIIVSKYISEKFN